MMVLGSSHVRCCGWCGCGVHEWMGVDGGGWRWMEVELTFSSVALLLLLLLVVEVVVVPTLLTTRPL